MVVETGDTGSKILKFSVELTAVNAFAVAAQISIMEGKISK